MRICGAVWAIFLFASTNINADTILTAANAGSFEYDFSGNTSAQFGAMQLLTPGNYDYLDLPFPFPSGFNGHYLLLSNSGIFTFESRDVNYIEDWVLIPDTPGVPGFGKATFSSVTNNFYYHSQLLSTTIIPGSATLTLSASTPEPTTFVEFLAGLLLITLYKLSRKIRQKTHGKAIAPRN